MSTDRDTARIVRSWLEEGVTALPDRVLDTVLDQVPATPQRRPWGSAWRVPNMSNPVRYGIAAAAVLVVALVGLRFLAPVSNIGPPLATASAPPASVGPTAWPVPSEGLILPGTYEITSIDGLRITFTTPAAGWQKNRVADTIWTSNSEGRIGFGLVENVFSDPCAPDTMKSPPLGASVDDLAGYLADLPGVGPVTSNDVQLSGFDGKLVEITIPDSTELCDEFALWGPIGDGVPLDHGRTRFWILDVEGKRLVVAAVERSRLQTVWRNELQQIVDSIQIQVN
jgi:hypothetical protein